MFETVEDRIDVIVAFAAGGPARPLRFRWKGQVHRVVEVGARVSAAGEHRFGVVDDRGGRFMLRFHQLTASWTLTMAWT